MSLYAWKSHWWHRPCQAHWLHHHHHHHHKVQILCILLEVVFSKKQLTCQFLWILYLKCIWNVLFTWQAISIWWAKGWMFVRFSLVMSLRAIDAAIPTSGLLMPCKTNGKTQLNISGCHCIHSANEPKQPKQKVSAGFIKWHWKNGRKWLSVLKAGKLWILSGSFEIGFEQCLRVYKFLVFIHLISD